MLLRKLNMMKGIRSKDISKVDVCQFWGGVIFQMKKKTAGEEEYQKNILAVALSASMGMCIAMAFDEDINMYEPEDDMWALCTRVELDQDIQIVAAGGRG